MVDPAIEEYLVAPKAEALAQIVGERQPAAVLITSSAEGKEIAGRLAVKLGSGLITDATDVAADGSTTQSVFAGNWTVGASVTHGVPVITVKPNAIAPEAAPTEAAVEEVAVTISDVAKGARIVKSEPKAASGRPELTEAAIVVSGGRGTGGDFAAVEALADALGAAVGASRAAVDSGWYPHAYQVGQTGKTVSPQLYVAAGISGRHPAPGRHADLEGHRGGQQGPRGADLRPDRPRHRGRPAGGAAGGDRAGQGAQGLTSGPERRVVRAGTMRP